MTFIQSKKVAPLIIFFLIMWGLILSAMGSAFGNRAITADDPKAYYNVVKNNRVTLESLYWNNDYEKSDFVMVEFNKSGKCTDKIAETNSHQCYSLKKLNDLKWIRKRFRNIRKPVVVYARDWNVKLHSAATMAVYGYEVKMLEIYARSPSENTLTLNTHQDQMKVDHTTAADMVITPISTSISDNTSEPVTPVALPSETEPEEEIEEEEEEGC